MNLKKHLMSKMVALALLCSSGTVLADFKSDIISACTAYQHGEDKSELNPCKLYIDGFIDSSLLTENAVVKPQATIERQNAPQSNYMKRAYQTRILTTSSILPNEQAHQFCIPKEYDRKAIASEIAKSMNINDLENKPLKVVIFETLIADFPCRQ